MKYAFSRLLLIFLLCFVAQTSLRAALAVQPLQLRTATDAVLSVGDSLPRKDTLTTAEAAMKARFDSLENRLAPRVDTTSLLQNNRKTTATTTAAQQDLQRQLKKTFVPNPQRALWLPRAPRRWTNLQQKVLETPPLLRRFSRLHLCFLVESANVYGLFASLSRHHGRRSAHQ